MREALAGEGFEFVQTEWLKRRRLPHYTEAGQVGD